MVDDVLMEPASETRNGENGVVLECLNDQIKNAKENIVLELISR